MTPSLKYSFRNMAWYHYNLLHAGIRRLINTSKALLVGLAFTRIKNHIQICTKCQQNKITGKKKYGKVPLTLVLWDKNLSKVIHVDWACGQSILHTMQQAKRSSSKSYFSHWLVQQLGGLSTTLSLTTLQKLLPSDSRDIAFVAIADPESYLW